MKTDTINISSDLYLTEDNNFRLVYNTKNYETIKRLIDFSGSMAALIVLSPLCLLTALYIKSVSPQGPVLFKQTRLGRFGKPFEIYKFRTMKVDAEKDSGPVWAKQNDNRFIFGGGLLRKAHLDEIPQFINVLKGDMSMVGPRPERPYFVAQLKDQVAHYEKRLLIKPGITGLAQVLHRADESIRDVKIKVRYDLFYSKRKSILFDLSILFQTLGVVMTGTAKERLKKYESGKKSQTSGINTFTV